MTASDGRRFEVDERVWVVYSRKRVFGLGPEEIDIVRFRATVAEIWDDGYQVIVDGSKHTLHVQENRVMEMGLLDRLAEI